MTLLPLFTLPQLNFLKKKDEYRILLLILLIATLLKEDVVNKYKLRMVKNMIENKSLVTATTSIRKTHHVSQCCCYSSR